MIINTINISVVIPTCDRQNLLTAALDAITKQTYQPYEIIIVDNGKKQSTVDTEQYSIPIKYIRTLPRFGVSQARNFGATICDGDYIAFLDDDDLWESDYLENIVNVISEENAEIILGSLKDFETKKIIESKSIKIKDRKHGIDELLKRNPGAVGSNTVIKRTTFFLFYGYDPYLTTGQDKAMILDILLMFPDTKIIRAEKAFVLFRQDFSIERQTEIPKRLKGKRRFLKKYWKHMEFSIRLRVILQLMDLYYKNIIHNIKA